MLRIQIRNLAVLTVGLAIIAAAMPAAGQDTKPEQKPPTLRELWEDLIHYSRVARVDLARKFAEGILEGEFADRDIYTVANEVKGSRAELIRAGRLEGMKPLVDQLLSRIEQGFQDHRADPEEIERNIRLLGGTVGEYRAARRRLARDSGEYAVPQLLQRLRDAQTPQVLRDRIITVFPDMEKDGVRPLSVALQTKDRQLQVILARALGEIKYPHAAPRLKELLERPGIEDKVLQVARASLVDCAGEAALTKSAAELYYDLSLKYYYRADSLRSDERYDKANVWYWREDRGAVYKPVPRAIFCDVYAMRMSRLALEHNPKFYPAISVWLSAILNKEANLPAGQTDATWPAGLRGARFYVRAASAAFQQHVLARALRDNNTPVATGAIEALAETSGATSLVKPIPGGAQPLVEALTYPDLRVRLLAALSLARATPREPFAGDDLVMPVLNAAFRISGKKRAVLIAGNPQIGNRVKGVLRDAGWEVIDKPDVRQALDAARATSGVDLLLLAQIADADQALKQLRRDVMFLAIPTAVIPAKGENVSRLTQSHKGLVVLAETAPDEAVTKVLAAAAGTGQAAAISPAEAGEWSIRAANAVRTLGLTKNKVYDIQRTRPGLIELLKDSRAEVRLAGAGALAAMPAAAAQQAIVGLGLDAKADEEVRIAALGYCTESVREFGKMLTDDQAQAVLDIATGTGSAALRDAAAQLLGSLNLPSEEIQPLVVGTEPKP